MPKKKNTRVRVATSDKFFGTGVHAPIDVAVPQDKTLAAAQQLQSFLKIGGQALAAKGAADFITDSQAADIERARGEERDALNNRPGYNASWDANDAEDDGNRAISEIEETLRGLDFENMTEDGLLTFFNKELSQRFGQAEAGATTAAYNRVLAPMINDYVDEKTAEHRSITLDNIKDMQAAKVMRNVEARTAADPNNAFDYEFVGNMTGSLFDGPEKNTRYLDTLLALTIKLERPDILENAPPFYPSGQPTPTSLPKNQARVNNAIIQARNLQKARATAITKANVAARKAGNNTAMISAIEAMANGDQNAEPMIRAYARRPGAEASQLLQLQSAYRSIRDDLEQQDADPLEVALLTTAVASGAAGLNEIMSAWDNGDGILGNGLEGVKRLQGFVNQWSRANDDQQRLTQQHKTHLDDLKARTNPATNGVFGKLDQRRATLQANAVLDYRQAVFEGNEDPEKAFIRISEQVEATLARFGEVQAFQTDDNLPINAVADLWLNNQMTDSRMRSFNFTLDQVEAMGLPRADESRLLDIIFK